MPEPQQPDPPSRAPPVCTACGKPMRLVSTEPATPYTNINQVNYECDCGATSDRLVADKD